MAELPDEARGQIDKNMVARVRTELIIFDFDGVLVDSELISARVQADALNAAGVDIDEAVLRSRFTGIPDREMYQIIEAETGLRLPDSLDADVSAAIRASYDRELREVPGVEAAVRGLSLPRCVASSALFTCALATGMAYSIPLSASPSTSGAIEIGG